MANEITTREQTYQPRPLLPANIDEAYRLAKAFAAAEMLPKSYMTGTIEKAQAMAFTAMQLGAEVGMSPMQSIQSIAVVNGMPSIWGDAQKALVIGSGLCEYIKEYYSGNPFNDDFKAICTVKRKGQNEVTEEFSVADAKKASLWEKAGTWSTYPKRMMKYRARAFALRDAFPDVLKGLVHSAEEMDGLQDVTPQNTSPIKEKKPRKESTEINEILKNQAAEPIIEVVAAPEIERPEETIAENIVTSVTTLQEPQPELEKPLENPSRLAQAQAEVKAANNPARKRMEEIRNRILEIKTSDALRQFVQENEVAINLLPDGLDIKIYETISFQKNKLGMSPAEDLFGG